jgi:alpha-1,3-glucan synthase
VTLLAGEIGLSADKIYVVASIYLIGSIAWWLVFRKFKSTYVLSVPFAVSGHIDLCEPD